MYNNVATNDAEKVHLGAGSGVSVLDIDTALIDISTQATLLDIKGGSTASLIIGESASEGFITLDTSNNIIILGSCLKIKFIFRRTHVVGYGHDIEGSFGGFSD